MAQWSLAFDGIDDVVTCGEVPLDGIDAFTVECWVWLDAVNSDGGIASQVFDSSYWTLAIDGAKFVWKVKDQYEDEYSITSGVKSTGWYHVAGVYDSENTLKLFVNGEQSGSAAAGGRLPTPEASPVLTMGQDELSAVCLMRLAWMRVSNSARYTAAFTDLPKTPPFPDSNTLAQWDFIEGVGTSLNNRVGEDDYDGVISGATWLYDAPQRTDLWGAAYERFGDEWTVLIGGSDHTIKTALDSLEIVDIIGSNRNQAVFRLEQLTAAESPATWSRVQIWHGGTLLFGGYVVAVDQLIKDATLDVVCHCVDWTVLLDKRVAAENTPYTGVDALSLLKNLTELGYVTELDATLYTDTGATGLSLTTNYDYVSDYVGKLAERSTYYWFVREDEEGLVYLYFSDAVIPAPYGLSTSPDLSSTMPLRVLQWSITGSERVNKIYVLEDGTYSTAYSVWEPPALLLEGVVKTTAEQGDLYSSALLTELNANRVTGRIETRISGVRSGMSLDIEHSVLNIDSTYLVHQVRTRPLGGGSLRCELTVSSFKQPAQTARDEWRKVFARL